MVGHITARTEIRATEDVCALIRDNFFKANAPDVREFLRKCATDNIPFTFSRTKTIEHLNARLSQIRTSHLTVYAPAENRWLWENEGSDTGLRARMIDGEVVVIGTLDGSPAREAGLKPGDAVITVNGEPPSSTQDVQSTAGLYKIARGRNFFVTRLKLIDLHEDLGPRLEEFGAGVGVLRLPSFLPAYFDRDDWLKTSQNLSRFSKLIVDLRGNPGGSFPAMLRALSPFVCGEKEVGRIWRGHPKGPAPPRILKDDLSTEASTRAGHDFGRSDFAHVRRLRLFPRSNDCSRRSKHIFRFRNFRARHASCLGFLDGRPSGHGALVFDWIVRRRRLRNFDSDRWLSSAKRR